MTVAWICCNPTSTQNYYSKFVSKHYCEDVGMETAESKAARDEFNAALEFLVTEKINEIYLLTIALSAVTEHATFICGVKLGVQLEMK